jgi:hypothetical protein
VQKASYLLVPVFLACVSLEAAAQAPRPAGESTETVPTHYLRTHDGSSLLGWVVSDSAGVLTFRTADGVLQVRRERVAELRDVKPEQFRNGQYWFPDPHATRLFYAPTARPLEQGETYFSDSYLFFVSLAHGVTDRFTLAGGMSVFPSTNFLEHNVYYLTPKLTLTSTERVKTAVGALLGYVPFEDGHSFGILYGVGTMGGPDGSITGGIGYGFFDGEFANSPTLMLGGAKRVSRRVSLVTENYMFKSDTPLLFGYGARFFGERIAVDLGFLKDSDGDIPGPGFPYVSFAVKWGGR